MNLLMSLRAAVDDAHLKEEKRRDSMQQDGARVGERLHLAQSCTALLENAARRALLVK